MKTAEEKAIEILDQTRVAGATYNQLLRAITAALKEQDKETRHACAEAVLNLPDVCETPAGNSAISPHDAEAACINVKAV